MTAARLQKAKGNGIKVIKGGKAKKEIKLRKDGQPKMSGGNKKKGESSKAEPIRSQEDLQKFRKYFIDKIEQADDPKKAILAARNNAIFVTGINTSLRISDILKITWGTILDENDEFYKSFRPLEKKTHKFNLKFIHDDMIDAMKRYYDAYVSCMKENDTLDKSACIFGSRESGSGSMTEQRVTQIIKEAGNAIGLTYNISTHTMRKTYSYWYLMTNKNDSRALTNLMARLNHATPQQTLNYAGITDDEFDQMDSEMSDFYRNVDKGQFTDTGMTKMTKDDLIKFAEQMFLIGRNSDKNCDVSEIVESAINIYLENKE